MRSKSSIFIITGVCQTEYIVHQCGGKTGNYHKVMTHTDTKCFKDPTYDIFMKSSRTFLARFGLVVLLLFLYFWMAARVWLCSLSKSSFRINMFSRRFCFLSLAISICLFSRPRQICFFSAIHTEAFNWNGMFFHEQTVVVALMFDAQAFHPNEETCTSGLVGAMQLISTHLPVPRPSIWPKSHPVLC